MLKDVDLCRLLKDMNTNPARYSEDLSSALSDSRKRP